MNFAQGSNKCVEMCPAEFAGIQILTTANKYETKPYEKM